MAKVPIQVAVAAFDEEADAVQVAPGGINGLLEWGFLVRAVLIGIGAYAGGGLGNRDSVLGMS